MVDRIRTIRMNRIALLIDNFKTSSSLLMLKIFNVRTFNFSNDVFVSCFSKGLDKVPNLL